MPKLPLIYIGIGSNDGDVVANMRTAVRLLNKNALTIERISSLYRTLPANYASPRTWLNAVVAGRTTSDPLQLLDRLQAIERHMGRENSTPFGPRIIDLDILFYDIVDMDTLRLTIPHPRIAERAFVLMPMVELAPNFMHPTLQYTMRELLHDLAEHQEVERYDPRTVV